MLHIVLHFLVPGLVVAFFAQNKWLYGPFSKNWLLEKWQLSYFILVATMLVDIDHLLADPIYDPSRCSIGFHPLHQLWFIALYMVLCFIPATRLVGLGLTIHMALDSIDCQVTNGIWIH